MSLYSKAQRERQERGQAANAYRDQVQEVPPRDKPQ
jgi:hypothetical protein